MHSLPLSRLEKPLKIHSRVLEEAIWLIPDPCLGRSFDAPVYTVEECRVLAALKPTPAELKAIHLTKTAFQGEVVMSEDPAFLRRLFTLLLERYKSIEKRATEDALDEYALLEVSGHLSRILKRLDELNARELS